VTPPKAVVSPTAAAPRPVSTVAASSGAAKPVAQPGRITFRYTGNKSLLVRGPWSGTNYHFSGPGATMSVDPRDAKAMGAVPNLRQV
jgi:hypothetical protein